MPFKNYCKRSVEFYYKTGKKENFGGLLLKSADKFCIIPISEIYVAFSNLYDEVISNGKTYG